MRKIQGLAAREINQDCGETGEVPHRVGGCGSVILFVLGDLLLSALQVRMGARVAIFGPRDGDWRGESLSG